MTAANEPKANLTEITWAHAVNSQLKLSNALSSDVKMMEADVVLGVLKDNPHTKPFPIMGHPPIDISDLSLENFLTKVYEYNEDHSTDTKGIKLDFKSIEAFEQSLSIINKMYDNMLYPVWLNADILNGPIHSPVKPVNAQRFLTGAKQFNRSTLSIGWTTLYGPDIHNGSYTNEEINKMVRTCDDNQITQPITFPVRAGLAAQSYDNMLRLINEVKQSTLTIWSSEHDPVNVEALRKVIFAVGLDRTYVDVPETLKNQLHLDQPPN